MKKENGMTATPVEPIVMRFSCIVADPPWQYGHWGKASTTSNNENGKNWAKRHVERPGENQPIPLPYKAMTVEQIKALPVASLAAENCDLYLWATQKYLPDAFDVLKAWGFRYCQTLTWCKAPRGTGQGGLFCPTTEFLLLGRIGAMPKKERIDSTWWQVKRPHNRHSAKPEFFMDVIEAMSDGPRLELFARRKRLGWYSWGNEVACDVDFNA
jgi:N6-adenosine-specific RNA methylase IME4